MKLHDIIALTVKISGLVLFVIVLSKIPNYVQSYISFSENVPSTKSVYYIMPLFIVAVGCVVLFLLPYQITNHLIIDTDKSPKPDQFTNQIQIVFIRLLGLLLLFWSVSEIVFHLFNYFTIRSSVNTTGLEFPASTYNYPAMIASVVEAAFAYVLLIKATAISSYLNSVGR